MQTICAQHGIDSCPPLCNQALVATPPPADAPDAAPDAAPETPTTADIAAAQVEREHGLAALDVANARMVLASVTERMHSLRDMLTEAIGHAEDADALLRKYDNR